MDELIDYWFAGWDDAAPSPDCMKTWFGRDAAIDTEIRTRFQEAHFCAARGELAGWEATPRGQLALILLLDQVPRNIWRGTAHAFATDLLALGLTQRCLASGADAALSLIQRQFVCMPLMHSESLAVHAEAKVAFEALAALGEGRPEALAATLRSGVDFEARHVAIIERFGRYPHRNVVLGRESTPEELAFLKEPGSSF